jgi:C-terminal processing protease CtpA/Prc
MESRVEGSTVQSGKSPVTLSAGTTLEDIYQTHLGLVDSNLDLVTVVAPVGKLGIVLDNPRGGLPVVHAIDRTSALRGKVLVGDILLSVDEVDCKGMSCHEVSILLGSRSQNAARTLVLARG